MPLRVVSPSMALLLPVLKIRSPCLGAMIMVKAVHRKSKKANGDMELHGGILLNLPQAALLVIL